MKNKFSRILGVGITLTILASLLMVASPSAPASAATLGAAAESFTGPAISGDVIGYAVAKDGTTLYAVQGAKSFNTCVGISQPVVASAAVPPPSSNYAEPGVRKSTNGGATWTTVGSVPDGISTFWYIGNVIGDGIYSPPTASAAVLPIPPSSIFAVAVAPDDANTVAILASDYSTTPVDPVTHQATGAAVLRTGVYYSTNGGTTWTTYANLNPVIDRTNGSNNNTGTTPGNGVIPAPHAGPAPFSSGYPEDVFQPNFKGLSVSPAVGGSRYIAVSGIDAASGLPGVWVLQLGGFLSGWVDITRNGNGWNNSNFGPSSNNGTNPGAAWTAKFSPNFAGDFTMAVLTGPTTSANDSLRLQLASLNAKVWNQALYPSWSNGIVVQGPVTQPGALAPALNVVNANLALDPNYLGQSAANRLAYISLATTTPDPAQGGLVNIGGVYRETDIVGAALMTDTPAYSVSLNSGGTNIVAGGYNTNDVYRLATPSTVTAPATWSNTGTYKRPGGQGFLSPLIAGEVQAQLLGRTIVNYGVGTNVYAGVAASALQANVTNNGDEGAFAASTNDGASFNDISLINYGSLSTVSEYTIIQDVAMSANASTMYAAITAWGGGSGPNAGSFKGARFLDVFRKDTSWKRVLTIPMALNSQFVIRTAPENADVVYVADISPTGTKSIYYSNDGGLVSWLPRLSMLAPTDMAVESAAVVYVLSGNQVSKSIDSGFTWDTAQTTPTTIASMTLAANIQSLGKDNILVGGGVNGGVAYSTNGYTSFTYAGGPVSPGTGGAVLVTADKLTTGGNLYAAVSGSSGNIYRWTIGSSTAWQPMIDTSTIPINAAGTPAGTGNIPPASGIALVGGSLYVSTFNNGMVDAADMAQQSNLYRTLFPTTVTNTTSKAWSIVTDVQETNLKNLNGSYNMPNPGFGINGLGSARNGIPVLLTNSAPVYTGPGLPAGGLQTVVWGATTYDGTGNPPTPASATLALQGTAGATQLRNTLFGTVGSDKSPRVWSIGIVPVYVAPLCAPLWGFYNTYELVSFTDTLAAASPVLSSPADQSIVPLNKATGSATSIAFIWSKLSLSSDYELQIALDSNFNQLVSDAAIAPTSLSQDPVSVVSASLVSPIIIFNPDTTYYWRVRSDQINVVSGVSMPFYSQWTAARSFRIGPQNPLTIVAPAVGATDVPVKPTFSWTPAQGATTYEIVVSDDPTFAIITFSRTTDKPEFASDESLSYNTNYYWRVRASAPASAVTPQVNGIFTTMAKPTTPPPPITVTTQPQPTITISVPPATEAIPSYLLWIIIAIGAVLVIALIVLIVRTRARGG